MTLPGLLIVALLNPMFNHYGVTMLYYIESSGNWVTLEALVYGIVLGAVMFVVIQWFSCYNKIMTSDKFIYLFGRIIPALSLILSMALRFVPRFIGQLHIIRNGQKSMGRDTTNGNILQRAYHGLNMLSILVTWALENAIQTSDSMRSRGYGLHGRTAFSIYRFTKRDKIIGVIMAGLFAVIVTGSSDASPDFLSNVSHDSFGFLYDTSASQFRFEDTEKVTEPPWFEISPEGISSESVRLPLPT